MPLGDSITELPGYRALGAPNLLAGGARWVGTIGNSGFPWLPHEGVSGNTLKAMGARVVAAMQATHPTVVTVLGGTNGGPLADWLDDHRAVREAIYAQDPNCKVVVITPPPNWPNMWTAQNMIDLAEDVAEDALDGHPVSIVDIYTPMVAYPSYGTALLYDGTHPNATGYALMETLITAGILAAISS